MPQLNPAPWLMILLFTWLVFTTILPTKVMSFKFPNKLSPKTKKISANKSTWSWPW